MIDLQTLLTYLTLISVPVGVFYHIMTLRNTRKNQELILENRRAQLAMQIWNKFDDDMRTGIDGWTSLEYEDFEGFLSKYGLDVNPDWWVNARRAASWYENMGVLVKEGLLDIRLITLQYGGITRMFWDKLAPLLPYLREELKYPRLWSETEYLCRELIKYMDEHPELKT